MWNNSVINEDSIPGEATLDKRVVETKAGMLTLQTRCSASLVESLTVDDGLRAFARVPEREHQLLVDIARHPDCILTLAYTETGAIVGEATLAPCDVWWKDIGNIRELGLEVSYNWRRIGLARYLLAFTLELDELEDMILLGMGLSWHWDTARTGVHAFRYRQLLAQTLQTYNFVECRTFEPNISAAPENILLARIGKSVSPKAIERFSHRLLASSMS